MDFWKCCLFSSFVVESLTAFRPRKAMIFFARASEGFALSWVQSLAQDRIAKAMMGLEKDPVLSSYMLNFGGVPFPRPNKINKRWTILLASWGAGDFMLGIGSFESGYLDANIHLKINDFQPW